MANPLDPLRQLANTTNLHQHTTDDLYERDRQLKAAIEDIPNLLHDLAEARRTIARELRTERGQTWGQMAKGYGVSRTRATQMVSGDSTNAGQRRARAAREAQAAADEQGI